MNKTKKLAVFASMTFVALVIILMVAKISINNSYRKQIPALPDFATISEPIKQQLTLAHTKALDRPTSDNIGTLGMTYQSSAYYDQAQQCYKLAVRKDKSKWIWSYYLGYVNQEMGDSKAAIESFNSVIKENPEITQVWYYLGKAYQNMRSGDLAEDAFKKIAYVQDNNSNNKSVRVNYSSFPTSAKFELARIYLNTKRLAEAEKILIEVTNRNHTIGPVYRLLGNVYSAKGDSVLSKKYLVRAQDLAEVTTLNDTLIDRLALMSRSELYLLKQIDDAAKSANPEWAQKLFDQALLYLPEDKYLIKKAVAFFLRMNNGKYALPYLDKHFKDFNTDFNEMAAIADLLFIKGFYSQAIPYYSQAKKLKPEPNEQDGNFALCYLKDGKKDSALFIMSELYEKNKNNPKVLAREVDFMLTIRDKDKAKFYLSKFRQMAPSDPKVLKLSGMIADMEGNQNAALQLYEASFKADPTDLETAKKLGNYYIEQRMWEKAISLLRTSMKYHPNESSHIEKLGTVLISCPDPKLQNIQEGLEFSERAFFHIASTITTLIAAGKDLAIGHTMLGDYKTASYYISVTLQIAKGEKLPQTFMNGLLKLESEIKRLSQK